MSCPCTVRAPPPSCERTAEKIRAWTRYPTSRSRTSSRRCPCRCPLGTSGFAPSLCPKDIQPTLQPLLRQDWFLSLLFVYAHVASNVPTSHTTSHKFKSHCWCLESVRFVVDLSVLFKVKFDFYWFQNLIVWVSDPFVLWFSPSGTTWLLDWKTPTGGSLNIRRGRRRTWLGTRISTARPRPRRARRREREYVGLKKQPFVCSNANALHELWVQSKIKSRCLRLTLSLLWIC